MVVSESELQQAGALRSPLSFHQKAQERVGGLHEDKAYQWGHGGHQ